MDEGEATPPPKEVRAACLTHIHPPPLHLTCACACWAGLVNSFLRAPEPAQQSACPVAHPLPTTLVFQLHLRGRPGDVCFHWNQRPLQLNCHRLVTHTKPAAVLRLRLLGPLGGPPLRRARLGAYGTAAGGRSAAAGKIVVRRGPTVFVRGLRLVVGLARKVRGHAFLAKSSEAVGGQSSTVSVSAYRVAGEGRERGGGERLRAEGEKA